MHCDSVTDFCYLAPATLLHPSRMLTKLNNSAMIVCERSARYVMVKLYWGHGTKSHDGCVMAHLDVFWAIDSWLSLDVYISICLWRCWEFVFDCCCIDSVYSEPFVFVALPAVRQRHKEADGRLLLETTASVACRAVISVQYLQCFQDLAPWIGIAVRQPFSSHFWLGESVQIWLFLSNYSPPPKKTWNEGILAKELFVLLAD